MPVARCSPSSLAWRIESWDELPAMQSRARRFLAGLGYDVNRQWCVVIALTEATTNAVKFAGGGMVTLTWRQSPPAHVVLEVVDEGPGLDGPERAAEDFFSEGSDWRGALFVTPRRGNGTGLGSIRRMMDVVTVENREAGGLRLVARKFLESE